MKQHDRSFASLPRIASAGSVFLLFVGCTLSNPDHIASWSYLCGDEPEPESDPSVPAPRCGEGDPLLPPEPTLPPDPTNPACILTASRIEPPEGQVLPEPLDPTEALAALDTGRINAALANPVCPVVKLVTDGEKNAFLSSHIRLDGGPAVRDDGYPPGKILWIDEGVTLFQSRHPALFQRTGNCGAIGVNDSSACLEFIAVSGTKPAIVGRGTIDGQGGEPMIGKEYSWWQASYALRAINGSIGQPNMINLARGTTGFVLYGVTLHNASKFHVKISSSPPEGLGPGVCDSEPYGKGYIVWGVTILTPSKWFNSAGYQLTPSWARNTDGIDPGTTDIAVCGVIACSTISTGDDQIAIKGGHLVDKLTIAHMAFGTGHGMSIGSETYGDKGGTKNIHVYDLTIDADSRAVGHDAHAHDFNGIRVKSDESRGGLVDNLLYEDVCLRDMVNGILISTAYNPLFAGKSYPDFRRMTFRSIRGVNCMALTPATVTMEGFNATLRPEITLDNVVFDNINPALSTAAEYAKFTLGPGPVNFDPQGRGVEVVSDTRDPSIAPKACKFPKLPAPKAPPGWKH